MRQGMLIIGGTGIVGSAITKEALHSNYRVTVISNTKDDFIPDGVEHIIADKRDENYAKLLVNLPLFDVVCDVIEYSVDDAKIVYDAFKNKKSHIIIFTTTLVYDRQTEEHTAISEINKKIPSRTYGGYVDCKLAIEEFWFQQDEIAVTLLRPYHVLGEGSLIGVLPLHNRDPLIVDKIVSGEKIALFNGGDNQFNYVHPRDLASAVLCVANNEKCYGQAYNTLNPMVYTAIEYYQLLAKILDKPLVVESIPYNQAYGNGWEMTLLPHLYDMTKLQQDTGFTPAISLEQGMRDALKSYPRVETDTRKIPVFKAMNKGARPNAIWWLRAEDIMIKESKVLEH